MVTVAMDVFRIEADGGQWQLLKAHGYKVIRVAEDQAILIEHVLILTQGRGAVIRFESDSGVRELRVGDVDTDEHTR
jgi:hypothetical protein